ncbi:MAG: response regulator [Eubacteriales bacterium]
MLKVLIVDDEVWICKLIQHSIDWESLHLEPVAFAHDGAEALEKIKEIHPDIIISDVRMPVLDGCALANIIKDMPDPPRMIMISGYQDFEYVQSAIKCGAVDYLLKPYDEDQLFQVLRKISNDLEAKSQKETETKNVHIQLTNSMIKLRDMFLNNLIFNKQLPASAEQIEHDYQFGFVDGIFQIILIDLESLQGDTLIFQLLPYIRDRLYSRLTEIDCVSYGYIIHKQIIAIVNYAADKNIDINNEMEKLIKEFSTDTGTSSTFSITIGIGSQVHELSDISYSWRQAADSISSRILFGPDKVYDINRMGLIYVSWNNLLTAEKESQFVRAVKSFSTKEIQAVIQMVFEPLFHQSLLHPMTVVDLYEAIIALFVKTTRQIEIADDKIIDCETFLKEMQDCRNWKDLPATLTASLIRVLEHYEKICKNKMSKPVLLAQEYVQEHFSEQIHLSDVAKVVFLHPYYFSDLFRNEVGISFSDYLTEYRMNQAKGLLKNQQYKIKDINEMVGYIDSKSFSKIFKKVIGLTPQEYRKLYS